MTKAMTLRAPAIPRDRPDDDVTERCQDDRQPDWRSVHDNAEASVEQQKVCSRQRVPLNRELDTVQDVEQHRERYVSSHRQAIRDRQTGEDVVDGRPHRWPGKNNDIDWVGNDAEDADGDSDVTVELSVPAEEQLYHDDRQRP